MLGLLLRAKGGCGTELGVVWGGSVRPDPEERQVFASSSASARRYRRRPRTGSLLDGLLAEGQTDTIRRRRFS